VRVSIIETKHVILADGVEMDSNTEIGFLSFVTALICLLLVAYYIMLV